MPRRHDDRQRRAPRKDRVPSMLARLALIWCAFFSPLGCGARTGTFDPFRGIDKDTQAAIAGMVVKAGYKQKIQVIWDKQEFWLVLLENDRGSTSRDSSPLDLSGESSGPIEIHVFKSGRVTRALPN